jgi:hypothetical protein
MKNSVEKIALEEASLVAILNSLRKEIKYELGSV